MSINRYGRTAFHTDTAVSPGTLRMGLWGAPNVDMTGYRRFTVTGRDLKRADMIAYRMYGDVTLWWVIALVNNIANPFRDLVEGTTLRIPRIDAVTKAMLPGVRV